MYNEKELDQIDPDYTKRRKITGMIDSGCCIDYENAEEMKRVNPGVMEGITNIEYIKLLQDVLNLKQEEMSIGEIISGNIIPKETIKYNNKKAPEGPSCAWTILKKGLKKSGKYNVEEIEGLEKGTLKILNCLSDDTISTGATKGMVVGYVQSGKTTSIESLIAMAADYGYNTFLVLSGTIENLRKQNSDRIKNDIEYSTAGNIHWSFVSNIADEKAYKLIDNGKVIVTVCLKNSSRLKKMKNWLMENAAICKTKMKLLVIDDEADQASLNTCKVSKEERSKINALITELIDNNKIKAINYIGYTATPYGNFLNEIKSIYPKDFIYMLPKSRKYIGAQEIFGYQDAPTPEKSLGLDIKRKINNNDYAIMDEINNGLSSDIPESLKDAICWFLATAAIFRYQGKKKPISMLVHTSRKVKAHQFVSNSINNYIKNTNRNKLLDRIEQIYNEETSKFKKEDFNKVMSNYGQQILDYPKYEDIEKYVVELLECNTSFIKIDEDEKLSYTKGINMVIDNCSISKELSDDEFARLVYPSDENNIEYATAFIIVGGDTLSRGLTIENLTTTYFCRKVGQVDTLMQMGRWFGYRVGYELLPRVWIDTENIYKFDDLTEVEYGLREDLSKYELGKSPMECGPNILNSFRTKLILTARNKSQSMITSNIDYSGAKAQTVSFANDFEEQRYNLKLTNDLINNLGKFKQGYNKSSNYLKENVKFEYIKEYLKNFKFSQKNKFFKNIDAFCNWIEQIDDNKYNYWNIIISNKKTESNNLEILGEYKINTATRSIKDIDDESIKIGVLRDTTDIISDIELKDDRKYSEKEIINIRENYPKSQLIIYVVDGKNDNTPNKKDYIKLGTNIVGLYLYVPGTPNKDNVKKVTIKLPKYEEEE